MGISREAQAIIDYVESSGLPYRVTDVNGPGHSKHSYHYARATGGTGLAVDFAGVTPGVSPTTARQMLDIYRLFWLVAAQLAELIYSGAGVTEGIKNGRRVHGISFFGPYTWGDHRDHVHVAVPRGVFLTPLSHPIGTLSMEENVAPDNPDVPNLPDVKFFVPVVNAQTGECRGYYIVATDGQLHAFGPGAPFWGRSEVVDGGS